MDNSTSWNSHDEILASAGQDDFQQFLDLGMNGMGDDLEFNFQDYDQQQNGQLIQHHGGGDAMDTTMDHDIGIMGQQQQQQQQQQQKNGMMQNHIAITTSSGHPTIPTTPIDNGLGSSNSLLELDAQIQYLQLQRQEQQQRMLQDQQQNYYARNRMVPPTPNSIELHSGDSRFFQSDRNHHMYETYQMRLKEAEMAFTPLVSPAVTPLETHFNLPEYTIPGAYFSPLSSPALHAQHDNRSMYDPQQGMPGGSNGTSPVNMTSDMLPPSTSTSSISKKPSSSRKASSKPKTPRHVRQSPIVKPQRRKVGSTSISAQTLSELVEPALSYQEQNPTTASSHSNASAETSETDSISPEHLSEMAPPPLPRPGSVKNSPYLIGQNSHPRVQQIVSSNSMHPATPASLMRIAKGNQNESSPSMGAQLENDDHLMEGFSLPEAANPRPEVARLDTQSDGQTTPTLQSAKSFSNLQSLPPPAISKPQSVAPAPSPQLRSQGSGPATTTTSLHKTPKLAARGSQKRHSVTSVHVSPALRPKISPSIKPLIRGSVADETASLLLATKSNYQNILEGTHFPGVSYPSELSTNLTSKRTSHKIAEQGRRNRINSALQEIATLLPTSCNKDERSGSGDTDGGDKDGGDKDGGDKDGENASNSKGGQSANSKASTVELAIEYIKQLKKDVEAANKRAEEAERRLEAEKKIEAQKPSQ